MTNISDIKLYSEIYDGKNIIKNIKMIVNTMSIIIKTKILYEIVSAMKSMYHKMKK